MSAWLERLGLFPRAPDTRPRAQIEDEIREELEAHIALRAHDHEIAGMSPAAALAEARSRFGNADRIARQCRDIQMKERLMLQRVNAVLIVVLLAGMAANLWVGATARDAMQRDVVGVRDGLAALGTMLAERPVASRARDLDRLRDVEAETRKVRSEITTLMVAEKKSERHPVVAAKLQILDALTQERDHLIADSKAVIASSGERVYVLGKVAMPGTIEWRERLTLTKVIALSGDFEEFANRGKVRVVREREGDTGRVLIEVDFDQIVSGQQPDIALFPDDLVVVPESFF